MSMQDVLRYRWLRGFGGILAFLGLVADGTLGIFLLAGIPPTWQWLAAHLPIVVLWAVGINLACQQDRRSEPAITFGPLSLNRWGIAALILSLLTFPGFVPVIYTLALLVSLLLRQEMSRSESVPNVSWPREVSPILDLEVEPLVDMLHDADIETRRTTIAALTRNANPEMNFVLRQLLLDKESVIRNEASLALTRLEDGFSRRFNVVLENWLADPRNRESCVKLADAYFEYASSNLLDEVIQHSYLAKARDLLEYVITQDIQNAEFWFKLARVRQGMDDLIEALRDARFALVLQPDYTEAYLLAMDLAFNLHSWDMLITLAEEGKSSLKERYSAVEEKAPLEWWAALQKQGGISVGSSG